MQTAGSRSRTVVIAAGLAVFIAAFATRAHYQLTAVEEIPLRADAAQYYRIAWNLLNHGVFSSALPAEEMPAADSYRGPLYPVVIAGLMLVAGESNVAAPSFRVLMLLHALAGAVMAVLVLLLGRRWMPFPVALAAAGLCCIWPLLITLSGLALTETLFGSLLMLAVVAHGGWSRTDSSRMLVCAALAWAACILINPVALLLPFIAVAITHGRHVPKAALFLALAVAPQTAWTIRNSGLEEGTSLTAASRLLENVLIGMEPDFNEYYQQHDARTGHAARERVASAVAAYAAGDASALTLSWRHFSERPAQIFAHYVAKPWEFWRWDVQQGHGGPFVYRMLSTPMETSAIYRGFVSVTRAINPALIILAVVPVFAVVASRRWRDLALQHREALLVLALVVYATVVHTLLTPDARYAAPFRPFQFLISAWGAWIVIDEIRRRVSTGIAPAL